MKSALDKGNATLFLASGRLLIQQKSRKLRECGIRHGVLMDGYDMEMEGYQNLQELWPEAECIVASKDTLWSRAFLCDRVEMFKPRLIIIDESRVSVGKTWQSILDRVGDVPMIGLDATPARGDGRGLGSFWSEIVVGATHEELLRNGFLVPCRVFAPWTVSTDKLVKKDGDWSWEEIQRRMMAKKLVGNVVSDWKRFGENRPTACFASGVDHSIALRDEFREHGIAAEHIDANTGTEERDVIFERWKSGEVKVVSNFGVIVQGADFPFVSCGILAFSTGSLVKLLQVTGRVFRTYPEKCDAVIIDHGGNVHRHGWPQEDREWSLDDTGTVQDRDESRREKQGAAREPIVCPKCFAQRQTGKVCPNCGHSHSRTGLRVMMESGELREIPRKKLPKQLSDDQKIWGTCLGICAARAMTVHQAKALFFRKTGRSVPDNVFPQPKAEELKRLVRHIWPGFARRKKAGT